MFTEAEKAKFLAEAQAKSKGTGLSQNAILVQMAQQAGMSLEDAERGMGWQPGSLSSYAQEAARPAQTANLGMGSSVASGPQPASSVTPLSAADRDSWRARFDSEAASTGQSAGQRMYEYAKANNLSNDDVDRYMGYTPGTSQSWVQQNISGAAPQVTIAGNNTTTTPIGPYQSSNLGMGGGSGGGSPGSLTGDSAGGVSMSPGGSPMPTNSRPSGVNPNYPGVNNANPYLSGMASDIGRQVSDTWSRNILPSIRSGAMQAGGYGGSRQGVVEANAMNDLGKNYVSGLTNLYGTDWTNQQGRNLQQRGMDQSYDLGLRNNDLGFSNLDYQINQGNFGNQLAAANFGLGVQNQLMGNNATGVAAGTQIQNTPLDYQKYLNSSNTAYGNAGGTRNGTTTT